MVVVVVVVVVVCAGTEKGSRAGSWNTGGSEKREKEGSRQKFYYKIANFLLKPGTPNKQQKYNRLKKKIVQNNNKLERNSNNWIREKRRSDGQKRNDGKIYILVRVAMTGDVNQVDRVAFPTKVWYGRSAMPFLSARANLGIRLEVDSSSESGRGTADKNTSYPPVVLARNQVPNPRVGAIFISCPEAADVIRRIARRETVAKGRESAEREVGTCGTPIGRLGHRNCGCPMIIGGRGSSITIESPVRLQIVDWLRPSGYSIVSPALPLVPLSTAPID
ncbi:hypothetical protein ALC56_13508 [Trachymyrmex septentrionalis]|uniref:Uncharacterized protein n=1 Tax=Trachymyrmex septentrionalis TaxID=34720 RepID=A0A195EV41_9HYME|nr:hypothetical protein ALC56_13508 [Trachymyrmex septentrionalis]